MKALENRPWADTLEEPNVNRPFYAFGALLAALALTMLAVSSTSRSTSVSRLSAHAPQIAAARDRHGFCGMLIVLPAAEDGFADTGPTDSGDRLASEVKLPVGSTWTDWECPCSWAQSMEQAKSANVTRITLATHDPALLPGGEGFDCRSHHDRVYDMAVYGTADAAPKLTWDDYSLLLDDALASTRQEPTSAEFINPVRSGQWLVDFAATRLDQAGLLLRLAAEELRHAAGGLDRGQMASQTQPDQR
jgi:hypothetical protein